MRENTLTNTSNMVMFSEEIPGQHPALEGCSNSAVMSKIIAAIRAERMYRGQLNHCKINY